MLIPPEALIDGCMRTLIEAVLPDVSSRFARGQLYAVADVLQNLRDRIEPKRAPLEEEARSAGEALARVAAVLGEAGRADLAAAVRDAAAAAPEAPPAERAEALERAVVEAFAQISALPAERAEPARRALAAHLAQQALREVALLKASLLTEISKG